MEFFTNKNNFHERKCIFGNIFFRESSLTGFTWIYFTARIVLYLLYTFRLWGWSIPCPVKKISMGLLCVFLKWFWSKEYHLFTLGALLCSSLVFFFVISISCYLCIFLAYYGIIRHLSFLQIFLLVSLNVFG